MTRPLLLLPLIAALGACNLEPPYATPAPLVPSSWPVGDPALKASEANLAALEHRAMFVDPRLERLIDQALANNQDVKLAVATIGAARGLYRIQQSALLPTVTGGADTTVRYTGQANANGDRVTTDYTADVGASAFEIDLFGRVRSLSNAALNGYFATEAAARATRLTLVADVADAWFTLATDRTLLAIASDTVASARQSERLTRMRLEGGIAPRTDLRQAETVRATAESDLANLTAIVGQDRNALRLLAGSDVIETDLPLSIEEVERSAVPAPAGLDSSILLRRPDVIEAEFRLRSANAQIGAARAAFFPRLSLTGLAGLASGGLTSLFTGNAFGAAITPSITLPIFGGANSGNLANARAQREGALAAYQKSLQVAFRDVADALARRATVDRQLAAQLELEAAARDTAYLTAARYKGGVASFLESLDAQRSLYAARRSLANTRLLRARSVVTLYRSLGGDPTL